MVWEEVLRWWGSVRECVVGGRVVAVVCVGWGRDELVVAVVVSCTDPSEIESKFSKKGRRSIDVLGGSVLGRNVGCGASIGSDKGVSSIVLLPVAAWNMLTSWDWHCATISTSCSLSLSSSGWASCSTTLSSVRRTRRGSSRRENS